jgi:fatty-acyl-CoA synthase
LRISQALDMTGTYKLRKVDLQRQSYAQSQVQDPLWVIQEAQNRYARVSPEALAHAGYPVHPLDQ